MRTYEKTLTNTNEGPYMDPQSGKEKEKKKR